MIIYWIVIAVLRFIAFSLLQIQIISLIPYLNSPSEIIFVVALFVDYGKWIIFLTITNYLTNAFLFVVVLIVRMILVVKLYNAIKQRDQNNFQELTEQRV